jgi:hypothetical protein
VLHKAEKDKHTYCVFDGATRYEYVSQPKKPVAPQLPKPPPIEKEGS